ncbi:beta-1,3-galactosyl-O-glycosyl-glycoprotein beta-1,6-N-acetylglucosaminyltransferase 4-like [Convolutriloba macropyga]|uniref:beta-1,3-galactosyl-O-glycosyl-glycoprotein beta-1,6-N-acetylglucosaminyltransferase 4-like n=1 Tax=Convolutriloba macropyga TaxID=536237 RepID=UPI003F525D59
MKKVTYFFILFLLSFILFYLKYMDTEIGFESYEVKLKPDLNYASENDLERIYPACAELWNGSSSNVKIWSAISVQNHVLENATDEEGNFPSCETYFEKRQQFYEPSSLTEEEKNFPIAFSLVVYHNFEQIEQLFMSIYRTSNFYCIHIDNSASQQIQDQIRNLSRCFSEKVFVAKNSVDVVHSSISVLLAELVCIEELLKFSSEWKYLINLTGEELPLMTNLELVTVLTKLGGSNVIEGPDPIRTPHRYPKHLPWNMKRYKSSVHFLLSHQACKWMFGDGKKGLFFFLFSFHGQQIIYLCKEIKY